jgi:magnesium transporter
MRRRSLPGAPPGTLITPHEAQQPVIDVLAYSAGDFVERQNVGIEAIREAREQHAVTWVNVTGLGDASLLVEIAEIFGLHQLALEDVLNVHQRPKVEEFDDHVFIVVRMIASPGSTESEQVSIFLGKDYVLSVQEQTGDCFETVRQRVRKGKGLVRRRGADYLCYTLIDAAVDAYFPVLEILGEKLEQLEDTVVIDAEANSIRALHDMKRTFLHLRRAIWPHREMLSTLVREDHFLLTRDTQVYLRDCYDHTIQLMDIIETYRETASGLVDVYISSVSAKLNEIMKVLTIIATVFMPLGFIASLYGMNFDRSVSEWNMPELGWRMGYLFALGLMTVFAIGFIVYFWRKGWLTWKRRFQAQERD